MRARELILAAKRSLPPGILPFLLALPIGLGIFAAAAAVQVLAGLGFLPSLLVEEALKLLPFLIFALLAPLRARSPGGDGNRRPREVPELRFATPLYSVFAFALVENMSFFLDFPSAGIYWRIGWSLLLHADSGFAYCLAVFSQTRPGRAGGKRGMWAGIFLPLCAFALCSSWHALLNHLASGEPGRVVLVVCIAANAIFFFLGSLGTFDILVRRRYAP